MIRTLFSPRTAPDRRRRVAAQLVGSVLRITGDDLAKQIVVASVAGGRIAVAGNGTTVNGAATPFVTTGPVRNIVALLAAATRTGVRRLYSSRFQAVTG